MRLFAGMCCLIPFVLGCSTLQSEGGSAPRHPELKAIWRDYRALPGERAIAIAGQLRQDRWVFGASGGHHSSAGAAEAALAQCRERRAQRRMQEACGLYATGDEVVWSGP